MNLYFVVAILLAAHQACGAPSGSLKISKSPGQKEAISVSENEAAIFTSPGYPESYENDLNVEYTITGPEGHYLYFRADYLDTEAHFDILTLSETDDAGKKFIGTFHSGEYNYHLQSSGNVVRAVFRTDDSVVASGFRVEVHAYPKYTPQPEPEPEPHPEPQVVEVAVDESQTSFTSPGYPAPYGSNQQVDYHITAPEGHKIQFHAEFYDVEQGYDTLNFYDYVPEQGLYYIGSLSNQTDNSVLAIVSSSNIVHVQFRTDGSDERGGFSILAWSIPVAATEQPPTPQFPTGPQVVEITVEEHNQVIFTSPGYPAPYGSNQQVAYHFSAPEGHKIQFHAEFYDLEQGYDTLNFFDYVPEQGQFYIGSLINQTDNSVLAIVSSSNLVHVLFHTDGSVELGGFSIQAWSIPVAIPESPSTPQVPTGPQLIEVTVEETGSETFTSPGYPEHYADNLEVTYFITGPPGSHLQFDVDYLELESCCDHLEILHRDEHGSSWTPPLVAGEPAIVNDNSAYVYFRTDSSVTAGGFSVRVTSIQAGERK